MKHQTYKHWFDEAVKSLQVKLKRIQIAEDEMDRKVSTRVSEIVPSESSAEESSSEEETIQEKIIETFEDKVLTAGDIVKYIDRTQPAHARIQKTKVIEVRGLTHPHPLRLAR